MSLSINNNSASLVALEALNAAQSELSKTENTVSTGKKVTNAADNPAIYSIAAQMNGNLQGMIAVSDSLSLGAQVVATANTAGNQIVTSLQSLQNTVSTAGQTGTDASAMATQILSTLDSINSYARNATFSGVNLLTSGSDAVNAYNGTTLRTVTNVQGQTQAFTTMSGSSTTLVDALGLTSNSAAGSSAAESTQHIFTSLNQNNVAELKTGNLTSNEILLGNGETAGSTVTVNGKTFEFVQSGKSVSTASNIAVTLDSGFSTKDALSALVSSMNGAGVHASLNSDHSIAVYTGGTNPTTDVTGTLTQQMTSKAFALSGTTFAVGDGTDTSTTTGDVFTIGGKNYELVSNSATLDANGKTTSGNIGIAVSSSATATDIATALANKGITGLTASGSNLTYTVAGATAGTITFTRGGANLDTTATPLTTGGQTSKVFALSGTNFAVGNGTDTSTTTGDVFTIGGKSYELVSNSATLDANGKTTSGNIGITVSSSATATDIATALASKDSTDLGVSGSNLTYTITGTTAGTITFTRGNVGANLDTTATAVTTGATTAPIIATNGSAADQIAVGIKGGVASAVSAIQSAITNMSSVMQNLGNYSNTLSGLSTYSSSLKDAVTNGVSALTDADMAAASAKLTSLQTKQSLAIKSLMIANGQSQSILSLFQ